MKVKRSESPHAAVVLCTLQVKSLVKSLFEILQGGKSLRYAFGDSHIKKHVHMHIRS